MADGTAADGTATESGWPGFWHKDDWWAIIIGFLIVAGDVGLFLHGGTGLRWLAALPPRWKEFSQITGDLATNWPRYLAQFGFWLVGFSAAARFLGYRLRDFVPAFAFLYGAAYAIFVVGQWDRAVYYNLEPPLVALLAGLLIANTVGLPRRLDAGFRGELYIKTGIVLLGATVPFSLIALAGPVAILQASIVSIVTFGVIFWTAVKLGLDRRFAATLGVGGAVCGVSAAIAVAGAVGAKKEDAAVTISAVILWAIAMIFILPLAARGLSLPTGIAGAWIGTSEFADAAGIAAAQTYGGFAGKIAGISGTPEQALQAFTLMKVVGRDVWIGIWAVVLAVVASTRWQNDGPEHNGPEHNGVASAPDAGEIWRRFPRFVLGFLGASAIITVATAHYTLADYNLIAVPKLIAPIKDLRTWAFIFCFFSIGLTTRLRELADTGRRPFAAFSVGVLVNVVLGFALSVHVFGAYWERLGH